MANIKIDPETWKRVQIRAITEGKTASALVNEAIRLLLGEERPAALYSVEAADAASARPPRSARPPFQDSPDGLVLDPEFAAAVLRPERPKIGDAFLYNVIMGVGEYERKAITVDATFLRVWDELMPGLAQDESVDWRATLASEVEIRRPKEDPWKTLTSPADVAANVRPIRPVPKPAPKPSARSRSRSRSTTPAPDAEP